MMDGNLNESSESETLVSSDEVNIDQTFVPVNSIFQLQAKICQLVSFNF